MRALRRLSRAYRHQAPTVLPYDESDALGASQQSFSLEKTPGCPPHPEAEPDAPDAFFDVLRRCSRADIPTFPESFLPEAEPGRPFASLSHLGRRAVDDGDAGVAPADGHGGRQQRPRVRLGVVHLHRLQRHRAVVAADHVHQAVVCHYAWGRDGVGSEGRGGQKEPPSVGEMR